MATSAVEEADTTLARNVGFQLLIVVARKMQRKCQNSDEFCCCLVEFPNVVPENQSSNAAFRPNSTTSPFSTMHCSGYFLLYRGFAKPEVDWRCAMCAGWLASVARVYNKRRLTPGTPTVVM